MHTDFQYLPLNQLQAGQYQPREDFATESLEELAQSLATQGMLEPLIVRIIAKQKYEIIAGERRWRAARIAGLDTVPCLIGEYTDKQACTLALIENIQREDLNLIEEAKGYKRLMDEFNYQQDEIALLVGKSRSHVANLVRLLGLSEQVKACIRDKSLSLGHARTLVGLSTEQQDYLTQVTIAKHWSVRQLEQEVKKIKEQDVPALKNARKDRDVERLQTILSDQVGAPVQIVNEHDSSGWLKLKFFDNDTLAGLLERLGLRYD